MLAALVLETAGQLLAIGTTQLDGLLPVLVVSAVAAGWVRGACRDRGRDQSSPAGTSDTVQIPPAGPSFAGLPVVAGLQIGEVVPEDAFVAPLRGKST